MGLSSWIHNLLARRRFERKKARSAREEFVGLFLTRLEDRRVLNAAFAVTGAGSNSLQLDNFTQTSAESLTVQDTGANYQFVLAEGVWSGTDGGGATGNGTNTLTVDKSAINNSIQINDSANIDVGITFDSSNFSGLTGSLDIIGAGAVSQNLGTTLKVSTLNIDAVSVSLGEATDDFGTVTANVTGAATLSDTNDITLGNVTTGTTLQVTTGGVMTLSGNVSSGGNVMLTASGSGADILMQPTSLISAASSDVTLQADDSVQLSRIVAGGANTVSVTATNGAITDADTTSEGTGNENIVAGNLILQAATGIGASGLPMFGDGEDIDINAGTLTATNTTSGAIQIYEIDDIALNQVANPGRIVLIDAGGRITDGTLADDSTLNIIADQVGLRATGGIGDGIAGDLNDIDTNVNLLAALTNTGDVNIDETDGLFIGSVGGLNGVMITNSDGTATGNDDITVLAAGTLTVSNAVINNDGGDVVLTAEVANDLLINADVLAVAPGNITLTGQNVTLDSTGTASPTVQITGTGMITSTSPKNGPVTGTGIISVNAAATTSINANSTLRTGGGVIQITTDDLAIDPTGLIAANAANGGVVMIRNATAGRNIELGGTVGGAVLNISDAELDRIAADSLRIGWLDGVNDAGDITFTGTFSAATAMLSTVQLFTGGNVTQNAGAGFVAGNIGITTGTGGSVTLGDPANDAVNTLAVSAGGSVTFNDATSLTVGQVTDAVDNALPADGEAGVSGVTAMDGATGYVDLQAQTGALTVLDIAGVAMEVSAAGVNAANNLAVNLFAAAANGAININAGANITGAAGAHRYTADNMDIQGTITASATDYSVNLRNASAGVAIDLGSTGANAANNTLELSDAELDRVATNLLAIGRNTGNAAGNITFTEAVSANNTGTLHLITAGTVTDTGAGAVGETNLLIEAGGGLALDNIAGNDVDTLAALISGGGAGLVFMDKDDVTVGTVNRLTVTNDANETAGLAAKNGIDTNGGNVQIVSNTDGVNVSQTINTTSTVSGQNSGSITITAQGVGGIQVDAPLVATGITAGTNGQGGDITLTTANGDINVSMTGSLNALGGGSGAVDGGNITLDANGQNADVIVSGPITTNDVDGVGNSVSITADDAVSIGANLNTAGLGTVSITANDSSADGDSGGALTMNAGTLITAANGNVTLQTKADNFDEATITVQQITTAGGEVLIDANGINADAILQDKIATTGGGVTVKADDTVSLLASSSIVASGAGNVTLRADDDDQAGNSGDQIFMEDNGTTNAYINAGTGTITLRTDGTNGNGGLISITQLTTDNATAGAVTINSNQSVVDAGDSDSAAIGGIDIQANANAASTINITAITGVGTSADAIDTSGVRFNVNNTGAGVINIANVTDSLDVVIDQMKTTGSLIIFTNTDLDGIAPGSLTIATTGVVSASTGGSGNDITITTVGDLNLTAPVSTEGGSGGTFTVNGGVTFTPAASILLGTGNITLNTGAQDIIVNSPLTIAGPTTFNAPRDIIVNAALANTTGDMTLSADSDTDGVGGTVVRTAGQVTSAGNLTMEGSDVFAATSVSAPIRDAVNIEGDGVNVQVQSAGNLTLQNRASASADADLVLAGLIRSTSGAILINPNNGNATPAAGNVIYLAGNTTLNGTGLIQFNGPVTDDGISGTPSNLVINTSGTTQFLGAVGVPDRIDSLTTNPGGTTELHGGFVSTVGDQNYGDNVLLNADAPGATTTTIAAGGNVLFQGTVNGLSAGAADDLILSVAGTTTFAGAVGGSERIGDGTGFALLINSTGQTFFNSQLKTQSGIGQDNAAKRITFREDVDIAAGDTDTFLNADVTLDSLKFFSDGNVTFGAGPGLDDLHIEFGAILDTSNHSKNITINSNISDPMASNQNLTFDLNQGELIIAGNVGTAGNRLGNIVIQRAGDFSFAPAGFQSMFVESLTQQAGIDAPGDAADTVLSGTINTSGSGVALSSTNVTFNGVVTVLGTGTIGTQAKSDITYTQFSTTTTIGGSVSSSAGGNLVMGEVLTSAMTTFVATIDANGGPVFLLAGGNLTISQIRTEDGFVGLTSTNGAVIDGGDLSGLAGPIGTNDIQAAQLRITAQTGIGATGDLPGTPNTENLALETMVSNLEASNGANGIIIANTGSLTIGNVSDSDLDGVKTASGDIMLERQWGHHAGRGHSKWRRHHQRRPDRGDRSRGCDVHQWGKCGQFHRADSRADAAGSLEPDRHAASGQCGQCQSHLYRGIGRRKELCRGGGLGRWHDDRDARGRWATHDQPPISKAARCGESRCQHSRVLGGGDGPEHSFLRGQRAQPNHTQSTASESKSGPHQHSKHGHHTTGLGIFYDGG